MANRTIEVEIKAKAGSAKEALKGFGMSLTDLKSGIDLAIGAASAFGQTAKAAFDFTKEGASIIQTTRSFEGMGLSIEALRSAAGGTIDDMTLMSSALTLLAGAGGELEPALSGALPALLEMARASNKLNPALGDTSFLFESLATGIKRGSPMILDNLGITVNIAKANEDYARALGKSVAQLTDEEKKIALLNATLEAGDTLIQQAGGSVDAYTDSWARAEAAFKNASDSLKANVAPSLEGTVSGVAKSVTAWSQLVSIVKTARDEYGFLRGSWEAFWSVMGANTDMMDKAAQGHREQVEAIKDESQSYIYLGADAQVAADSIITNFGDATQVTEASKQAMSDLAAVMRGELGNAWDDFTEQQTEAKSKVEELTGKITELEGKRYLTSAQKEELAGLRGELAEVNAAVEENAVAHEEATKRILFGYMEQRLGLDGLTEAELQALTDVAAAWGLIDQKTYDTIVAIDAAADAFEAGKTDIADYGQELRIASGHASGLYEWLRKIPPRLSLAVDISVYGAENLPPAFSPGGTPNTSLPAVPMAAGGDFLVTRPTLFLAGEAGPERATFTPQGGIGGGGGANAGMTVNIYTQQSTGSIYRDLQLVEAML